MCGIAVHTAFFSLKKRRMSIVLEALWKNDENDLPFKSNVNEEHVLQCLCNMSDLEKNNMKDRVFQWIKFNKWMNEYEEGSYQTRVAAVYCKIQNQFQ